MVPVAEYTDFTVRALEQVRSTDNFGWGIVVLIALTSYIYTVEAQKRNWAVIFAGAGLFMMDIFNETVNALVLHFSERAALWTTTGDTLYQPLVGLTVEIMFVFSIAGIAFVKSLPDDPKMKILGVNNRVFMVFAFSIFSVIVELMLRAGGIFHWEYWFWGTPWGLPTIVVFGYATFYAMSAWLFDMGDDWRRQLKVLGTLTAIDVIGIVVFGLFLGWM